MVSRAFSCLGFPWALALLLQGCVTVYHPLVSLQRPVAINPELANFEGLNLTLRCQRTDYTDTAESEELCQKLKTSFANQGATVKLEVPEANLEEDESGAKERPDLVIELTSRLLHSEVSVLGWVLCVASATMIPAVSEVTFAQDVLVKDAEGFLLTQDSLQGRFIRYVGLGFLGVNAVMDLLVRPKDERLVIGGVARNDFSRDFFAQLSQLAFQGRMRSLVLRSFDPTASVGPLNTSPAVSPLSKPAPEQPSAPPAAAGQGPAPAAAPAPTSAPAAAPAAGQPAPPPKKPVVPPPAVGKKPTADPDTQWAPAPFPQGQPK